MIILHNVSLLSSLFLFPDTNFTSNWNLGHNGIWMQHGWLGADEWFNKYDKQELKKKLRNPDKRTSPNRYGQVFRFR